MIIIGNYSNAQQFSLRIRYLAPVIRHINESTFTVFIFISIFQNLRIYLMDLALLWVLQYLQCTRLFVNLILDQFFSVLFSMYPTLLLFLFHVKGRFTNACNNMLSSLTNARSDISSTEHICHNCFGLLLQFCETLFSWHFIFFMHFHRLICILFDLKPFVPSAILRNLSML